ncbi:hypothetical protein [Microvirga flavescens]|uniref:hypothetical protein n=1 Tax=Microvirga flavescens TaxID=2249811 RepID=UPI001300347D|nr:hypothetical protein [Microvirga flavescens]
MAAIIRMKRLSDFKVEAIQSEFELCLENFAGKTTKFLLSRDQAHHLADELDRLIVEVRKASRASRIEKKVTA